MIRSFRWVRLLPLALLCAASTGHADVVYKCVGANGKVTYSQNPCYGEDWQRFGAPKAEKPKRPAKPTQDAEQPARSSAQKSSS